MSYKWHGDQVLDRMIIATKIANKENALDLKRRSIEQAPIESGDLRGNCSVATREKVVSPPKEGDPVSRPIQEDAIRIGFTLPYAKRQHEDLTLRHDRTDGRRTQSGKTAGRTTNMVAGGKAKYLEDPFNQNKAKYERHIANAIKRVVR